MHNNLHFRITAESNKSISFLDVSVTCDEHQLITSLYRKLSDTGLDLLWNSSQNRKYKVGLIRTLVLRICKICSKTEMPEKELNDLKKRTSNEWIPITYNKEWYLRRRSNLSRTEAKEILKKGKRTIYFTTTYYGQESLVFAS